MVKNNLKNAIESLFIGVCSVIEYKEVIDQNSGITEFKEIEVLSNTPCRLSYKNIANANQTETGNAIIQTIKLFYPTDIEIKNGSKIVVTQNNITKEYKNSGEPAVYSNHKELILELFESWC